LRNNGIHRGTNRCIVLHGSFNALLQGNVCLDNRGHNIYLEDGIEWGNKIVGNLVVNPKRSATICTDNQGAAGLWITNPNNTFNDNVVVGAAFGAWFTFPTVDGSHPFSGEKRGQLGGSFGASEAYFNDPASGYGPDSWVVQQEQTRTPAAAFNRNSFKGNQQQGITIDFRVYDSDDPYIPCLQGSAYSKGECPTCASVGHTFTWGPAEYDVSLPPSQRRYTPVKQSFEDIVVARTVFSGPESFSVWATGGLVSLVRPIFFDNIGGSSLGFAGECAGGVAFGIGGANLQFVNALFIRGPAPFKLYDGGYHCVDCRWAELDHLVTMRPGSPGNVNGLLMERSAPLGWVDSDVSDPLYSWVWNSGRVQLPPRTSTIDTLIDWSQSNIQGAWQAEAVSFVTTDGFAGTALGGAFTQWISSGNAYANEGWGNGARINPSPNFRQFYPCGTFGQWCGDGQSCSAHTDGRDWPNAPWNRR